MMLRAFDKRWVLVLLAAGMLIPPALAQDRRTEQAIKHRRAAFTLMATYVNRLVQTAEGQRPFDARLTTADARVVAQLSQLPWEGFIEGSERGDTRAREDIWLDDDKFKAYAADLQRQSLTLVTVTEAGDLKRFKATLVEMRNTCSACHKAYRKD
ncbi:MAG: cytochrome c [Curvibacter sp.]|jgi:cytochrome c556|nr:cytochrome C [Curvibacter sp.]|tara:strand:- start:946 stop:1410 length:465 start_codon:yes stop_codon:yes gene_type:complete